MRGQGLAAVLVVMMAAGLTGCGALPMPAASAPLRPVQAQVAAVKSEPVHTYLARVTAKVLSVRNDGPDSQTLMVQGTANSPSKGKFSLNLSRYGDPIPNLRVGDTITADVLYPWVDEATRTILPSPDGKPYQGGAAKRV